MQIICSLIYNLLQKFSKGKNMPTVKIIEDRSYVQYHLEISREKTRDAAIAIIPGAPERAALIASHLENPVKIGSHRGLDSWLGKMGSLDILVTNTGMGGPTLEIVVQELIQLGVKNFLRIGTTGAIQDYIPVGSLIVSEAAVRLDGTSDHYAPPCYPATGDLEMSLALKKISDRLGHPCFSGLTASSATFFPGQERYDSAGGYVRRSIQGSLDEWRNLNVLNFEMEAASLFTICRTMGLRAACICAAVANRTKSEAVVRDIIRRGEEAATAVGLAMLKEVFGV